MGNKESKEQRKDVKAVVDRMRKTGALHGEGRGWAEVPDKVTKAVVGAKGAAAVKELWFQDNALSSLPAGLIGACPELEVLYLTNNALEGGDWVAEAELAACVASLQEVNLSGNAGLAAVPPALGAATDLRQVYLNELPLVEALPASPQWGALRVLHVCGTAVASLPSELGSCGSLTQVAINDNARLAQLPGGVFSGWVAVEKLFLNNNALTAVPDVSGMVALSKLYMNGNALAQLPPGTAQLDNLEEVYVNDNQIQDLGPLARLPRLGKLYANNNQVGELPASLPSSLEILAVNDNALSELPATINWAEAHSTLKFLHIARNTITRVPASLVGLGELRVFEVDGNPFVDGDGDDDDDVDVDGENARILEAVNSALVKGWVFAMEHGS